MAKGKDRERPKEEVKEEEHLELERVYLVIWEACSTLPKMFDSTGFDFAMRIRGNCHSKKVRKWWKRCRP